MTGRGEVRRAVAYVALGGFAVPFLGVCTAAGWWAGGPIGSLLAFVLAVTVTVAAALSVLAWRAR